VLYLKAWDCLRSPPNLLDLAIKKEKIITKQKLWLVDQTETKSFLACPTCHSRTVSKNGSKRKLIGVQDENNCFYRIYNRRSYLAEIRRDK